jgi:hypothetical protein
LTCETIENENQCSNSASLLNMKCVWIASSSPRCEEVVNSCNASGIVDDKDWCITLNAAVGENNSVINCFWLYNSANEGTNDGVCRDKANTSLTCNNAKRKDQCEDGNVDKFGGDNCFWLLGNLSRGELTGVETGCINKVN